ncbi:MAG: ABC transporter permease, partial [Propionibacteriaceae bacterium]|nr:ABC transporter permease [Propionibacteriaceae bacterium]
MSVPGATPHVVRRAPWLKRNGRILLVYGVFLMLLLVYEQKAPRFTEREWRSISNSGMTLAIAGLGQNVVVLTGGIDLSTGSMIGLTNSIVATVGDEEHPDERLALGIALALLVGAAGGFVNGLLVAYGRLQPIIVTLATGYIMHGVALKVRSRPGGYVPFERADLLTDLYRNVIPRSAFLLAALVIIWFLYRRTRLSREIIATGSAAGAANLTGVNVARTKLIAFTISGLASAVAGVFLTAQTATGDPNSGTEYTLNSIAAVVLGGSSLAGGTGSFIGTIAGAYVLKTISS